MAQIDRIIDPTVHDGHRDTGRFQGWCYSMNHCFHSTQNLNRMNDQKHFRPCQMTNLRLKALQPMDPL